MTTTNTSGAADRAIENCPELNMGNYDEVDVERLNDWAIRANDEIDRLHALAAGQATAAPAQPAAQQGVAYAELPDEGEPWRGHKFKEVQRGCWRCDCGKTIKEVTSDQSTPASGGNYPVMPKRYTVDDDGEELFTAEKMRAFADATHTLRASHWQAPAETGNSVSAQADSVQEDAARWQDHVGKLDALVAYCPTCCQGFIAKQDMTRDEVLFACGKAVGQSGAKRLREALDLAVDHIDMDALRISHCKDAAAIDSARKQGARWQSAVRALTLHI